jgi:hypothetical protein
MSLAMSSWLQTLISVTDADCQQLTTACLKLQEGEVSTSEMRVYC